MNPIASIASSGFYQDSLDSEDIPQKEDLNVVSRVDFVWSSVLKSWSAVAMLRVRPQNSPTMRPETIALVVYEDVNHFTMAFPNSYPRFAEYPSFMFDKKTSQLSVIGKLSNEPKPEKTSLYDYLKATI